MSYEITSKFPSTPSVIVSLVDNRVHPDLLVHPFYHNDLVSLQTSVSFTRRPVFDMDTFLRH